MSTTEAELGDIGRHTTVRRIVISHLIGLGSRGRFVSTEIARDSGVGIASCNNVFADLRDAGWIVQTKRKGTAKIHGWNTGGINVAKAYIRSYDESRA